MLVIVFLLVHILLLVMLMPVKVLLIYSASSHGDAGHSAVENRVLLVMVMLVTVLLKIECF